MDLRKQAFEKALVTNFDETTRWNRYKDDHIKLKSNLIDFPKSLEIDVMVPIGSKAFIPGVLYHTNEILISHYSNYFSNVTSNKALEICELRIKNANERLKSLDIERDLFEQRLELPNKMNAFAEAQTQEIIEVYDEEAEKKWREEHKLNVRKSKEKESEERKKNNLNENKIDDDKLNQLLEELEMMEELENELDAINEEEVGEEENIFDIKSTKNNGDKIQDEIKEEKKNVISSCYSEQDIIIGNDVKIDLNKNDDKIDLEENDENIDNNFDIEDKFNQEILEGFKYEYDTFYESIKNYNKIHKYNAYKEKYYELENYLNNPEMKIEKNQINYLAKQLVKCEILNCIEKWTFNLGETENNNKNSKITFANEDMIKLIKSENQILNELILSDKNGTTSSLYTTSTSSSSSSASASASSSSMAKINYDPNLTFSIKFKHSDTIMKPVEKQDDNIIGSPADIYLKFSKSFKDQLTGVNNLGIEQISDLDLTPTKTILKNKSAVEQETHMVKILEDGVFESSTVDKATEMNFNYNKPKRKLSKFKMSRMEKNE